MLINREIKELIPFLISTEQNSLDFLGTDIDIIFWSYDVQKKEFLFSEGIARIFGYNDHEVKGLKLLDFFNKHFEVNLEEVLLEVMEAQEDFIHEYKISKKDGSVGWVRMKGRPIFSPEQELIKWNGLTRDISTSKFAEISLEESENKYRTLADNYALGVYISQDGKYKYSNKRLTEMTGYSQEELLEMDYHQLLDEESKNLVTKRVDNFLFGKGNGLTEINLIHKDKTKIQVELDSTIISYRNKPALMGTLLDITEKKKAQEMVNYLAYYDSLTGIPNRNLFYESSRQEIEKMKINQQKAALLFIGLDKFKMINDTISHHEGDQILKQVASKMKELVEGKGQIARYGGDKFVVLVKYGALFELKKFSKMIIQEVPKSLSSQNQVTPNIGISLFPKHGEDIESLLRFADIAMYNSKSNENRIQNYNFYDDSMNTNILRMNQLSNDLQSAIEENQMYLVYQPKIDLNTLELEGMEALIRWEHPTYGNISPVEFIPLAENNGFIHKMGDWVMRMAIKETQMLNNQIILNVNVSTIQLLRDYFVETIQLILENTQFQAERLNLEITESVALYDIDKAVDILNQLKNLGILISLDDFGTGYSSLSYLAKLPVDFLKIDRSFINDLENSVSNQKVVKSIIRVAHSLNMKVTGEGIETKKQADLLRKYKCDNGQGYYYSKPLPFNQFQNYLEQRIVKA